MTSSEKIIHDNAVKANLFAAKLLITLAVITSSMFFAIMTGFSRESNLILHRELYTVLTVLLVISWTVVAVVIIRVKGEGDWIPHAIMSSFFTSSIIQSFSLSSQVSWALFILGVIYSIRYCKVRFTAFYGVLGGVMASALNYILIPYSSATGRMNQDLIELTEDTEMTVLAGSHGFFKGITDPQIIDMSAAYKATTFTLIPALISYFFIVIVLIFMAKMNQKREIEHITTNEKIRQSFEEERKNISLIRSLCKDYRSVFYVDLEKGNLKIVNTIDSFSYYHRSSASHMNNELKMDVFFGKYIEDYVSNSEDAEMMRKLLDIGNLKEQLMENEIITGSFHAIEDGKPHTYSFRVVRLATKIGIPTEAIVAFRIVDAMVAEEKRKNEELEKKADELKAYSEIISNAGMGVWFINIADGEPPRMKANEKMLEILGISGQNLNEEQIYSFWYGRVTEEALPSVQISVQEMMEGQFCENTYRWEHPDKGVVFVRCGGKGVKNSDGSYTLSGYHADVTDIVYEREGRKNKASVMSDLIHI